MIEVDIIQKDKINSEKYYSIPDYHVSKEIGGIFLGHRDLSHQHRLPKDLPFMIPVPSGEKRNDYWKLKGRFALIKAVIISPFRGQILVEAHKDEGFGLVGEWHSHPNGSTKLSKQDMETIRLRVQKYGSWVVGLLVPKKSGNRLEMILMLFKKNNKTVLNRKV